MKHNIFYAIFAIVFFGSIFGLQAVAEAGLPLGTTALAIAGIFAVLIAGVHKVNKLAETEE